MTNCWMGMNFADKLHVRVVVFLFFIFFSQLVEVESNYA